MGSQKAGDHQRLVLTIISERTTEKAQSMEAKTMSAHQDSVAEERSLRAAETAPVAVSEPEKVDAPLKAKDAEIAVETSATKTLTTAVVLDAMSMGSKDMDESGGELKNSS